MLFSGRRNLVLNRPAGRLSPQKGSSQPHNPFSVTRFLLLSVLVGGIWVSCTAEKPSSQPSVATADALSPRSSALFPAIDSEAPAKIMKSTDAKISSSILALLDQVHARGLTQHTITESDAKSLSTQLVRIDDLGRIQVYLDVDKVSLGLLSTLREKEVAIELSNQSLRIIQAWIPFDRIGEVAALESVRHIRPPDYGFPRSDTP